MTPLLDLILSRRSDARLRQPGPTDEQLELLLRAATTVPDHGAIRPWRFIIVRDDARARFADALVDAAVGAVPDAPAELVAKVRDKAFAAPLQVVLIARVRPEAKVEVWEQLASAACTGYAITLAAHALDIGAVWKSTAHRDGPMLRQLFAMAPHDELLGWVNLGVSTSAPRPRSVDGLGDLTSVLSDDGSLLPFPDGLNTARPR